MLDLKCNNDEVTIQPQEPYLEIPSDDLRDAEKLKDYLFPAPCFWSLCVFRSELSLVESINIDLCIHSAIPCF